MSDRGYYKYVVLFPINEGLYNTPNPEDEIWFLWNDTSKTYMVTNRPKFMEGFGLML
jgi:hypothetical protein